MSDAIGKVYREGEIIFQQGEVGNCMYVIQAGQVEVILRQDEREYCLQVLGAGDFFGEMALFNSEPRSATVRALGDVRVLTLEKKSFLRRVHEDPSLAFNIVQKLCRRISEMNTKLVRMADADAQIAHLAPEWAGRTENS